MSCWFRGGTGNISGVANFSEDRCSFYIIRLIMCNQMSSSFLDFHNGRGEVGMAHDKRD